MCIPKSCRHFPKSYGYSDILERTRNLVECHESEVASQGMMVPVMCIYIVLVCPIPRQPTNGYIYIPVHKHEGLFPQNDEKCIDLNKVSLTRN